MSVDLTRRWFVFGTVASIAAASIAAAPAAPSLVIPLPSPVAPGLRYRLIRELRATVDGPPSECAIFDLIVRDKTWMRHGARSGDALFWRAFQDIEAICLLPEQTFRLEVEGRGEATITLIVGDKVDDGPPIWRSQLHRPGRAAPEVQDLFADNSLEARLARQNRGPKMSDEEQAEFEAMLDAIEMD
jgi:hypothetical protein